MNVDFERQGKKRTRTITVRDVSHPPLQEQAPELSSASSAASAEHKTTSKNNDVQADAAADATPLADASNTQADAKRTQAKEHISHWNIKNSDNADDADAKKQVHSNIAYEEI